MKLKKYVSLLLALIFLLGLMTGCGGSSTVSKNSAAMEEIAAEAPAMMADSATGSLTSASGGGSSAVPENRKWIITVYMSAETEDLDAMTAALDERITALNGYVEDQHIYNGSAYATRRYRSANLTIRIPAESVDKFTEQVSGIANVISQEKNLEDVTLSYVATESRMTALQTEEARLLELLAQAETMADLLEIEARLSDVRYELERYSSQLRLYDNQVDYATIYLFINEVQEYTPVAEKTVWERIRDGFSSSVKGLKKNIVDTLVWILANSPYLLVWGIVIAAACIVVRKVRRSRKAKMSAAAQDETK